MAEFSTPMMKQYAEIKSQYTDCLLFYRMGDFYELFFEDAKIGASILNITLTSRPEGKDGRVPMAGVPFHAVDSYLAKLVQAGYKVAICEQVSLPNKSGIIEREVVRIVTPGTLLDEKALEKKEHNYLISISIDQNTLGLAASDISTGFFAAQELTFEDLSQTLRDELSKLSPSECILPESLYNNPELLKLLKLERKMNIYCFHDWEEYSEKAPEVLKKHFGVKTLAGFGVEDKPLALHAASSLLGYLKVTQKSTISHIKKITTLAQDDSLIMDRSTMVNLELFSTIRDHDPKGSLLYVLDQTLTAMGGRLLKQWLIKPLTSKEAILKRHEAVEEFVRSQTKRDYFRNILGEVNDIERTLSRLSVGLGNARDLMNLKTSLNTAIGIRSNLAHLNTPLLKELQKGISPKIDSVIKIIEDTIVPEPPISLREGEMIQKGVSSELDSLRKKVSSSKDWVLNLEKTEREKTGISTLKVRFNKVFGFYIEVSKSYVNQVPKNYLRKQTLVNGERFITLELKEQEEIILSAEERINELEYQLFQQVLEKILGYTGFIQQAAESIAVLDCLLSFAYLAVKEQYTRPKIVYSGEMRIKAGRHPVVEKLLEDHQFVPNDLTLDNHSQQMLLITGPNMAGKSVLLRQIALIVLLNQVGSFVPAQSAYLSLVDRIFVRSGASDVITSGLSTFMVEMVETAHILNHATKNSLIIMDEIGRGTSTYDGISIAWAVAEFLVSSFDRPPKTLFATHYHELQALEDHFPTKIKNYSMAVENEGGEPIFLHTITPGGASHSFGVAVARLAGVPQEVINRAVQILETLEKRQLDQPLEITQLSNSHSRESGNLYNNSEPFDTQALAEHLLYKELEKMDIHQMTPLEALNKLAELKEKLKLSQTLSLEN